MNKMENPWIEFMKNPQNECLILDEDKLVIEKFNETANDTFRIHTEIMPAPFMGNVFEAPVLLLLTNPGYDDEEARKDYYNNYRHYWENEIQHKPSIPDLPLFCLDDKYIEKSNYWYKKLIHLINATSKEKVAKSIAKIQFFPYTSRKFKNIPNKILPGYLKSQKYNFYLVQLAMERGATIIILRSKKLWYKAIPSLEYYENKCITKNPRNTVLSKGNLERFDEVVKIINKK